MQGEIGEDAIENAWDALLALLDAYDQLGEPLPFGLPVTPAREAIHFEPLSPA